LGDWSLSYAVKLTQFSNEIVYSFRLTQTVLGKIAKIISRDWQIMYNHPVYYIETFVDRHLFAGTCYKAANFIYLGDTKGLGKDSKTKTPNRPIKAIYGYPLTKSFRKVLTGGKR